MIERVGERVILELKADFNNVERRDDEAGSAWSAPASIKMFGRVQEVSYRDTRPARAPATATCVCEPWQSSRISTWSVEVWRIHWGAYFMLQLGDALRHTP